MFKKLALTSALLATLAAPAVTAVASASATADLTVDPTAQQTDSRHIIVSGTYRCTPVNGFSLAQISVTLSQPAPGGSHFSNGGVVNVTCDGTYRLYSINTYGSVQNGVASYHAVLNAVPTRETIVRDGVLTVL